MLMFAMDCGCAGVAISLLIIISRIIFERRDSDIIDLAYLSAGLGVAIYLLARFAMSFAIMWSMWD